ncbi:unnamed protein product [Alopecurus aequalis]
MPKPPPLLEQGSPRPRKTILIHDDDDDRSGGHREPRSAVVGMGGQGGRRATGDRSGDSERGREGSSVGGRMAARSPPPRQNTLAPSSSVPARAGAKKTKIIEVDDDDEDGYEVRRERPEKAAARVEVRGAVKTEPPEYSEPGREDSRARGRAAASAPGGSRKAGKRQRESPVRRDKPHRAGGRAEAGSSGKQRICKGREAIGRHPLPSSSDESHGAPGKKLKSAGRGGSDWRGSAPTRQVGAALSSRTRSRNSDCRKVAYAEHNEDDNEMEEVSSDDSGESRDNQQEEDVVKEKTKVDDSSDSEDRYKSTESEEEELREDSYAGVDEEDTDDTTEEEEGEEESRAPSGADEAGEALRRTPISNAKAGGSTRPGGERTPPIRKKHFEGLCLVDNADTTSAGVGVSKRTRLQRSRQRGGSLEKKLLRRGTKSQPYCIEVSDSEPEEEVPPTVQTEEDRTFRSRPKNPTAKNRGASYRQQQTAAKNGCKDYEGCSSNPRRVKNYYAAYAGNPANRGNLQQGDISFKKNAMFPHKGKRGKLSAEQDAYQKMFNSIFDEIENHPNGSAPAQAQPFVDTQPLLFSFGDEVEVKEERDEFMDEMWGDLDSALETVYASSNDCKEGEEFPADGETLCKQGKHDLVTDDQIGIWCRRCNFIQLEIRYVFPPMGKWSEEREPRVDRELDRSINDILKSIGYEGECSIGSHRSGPVWDLVPGVREDMFPHQVEAFEFMWNKLAGGTDIEQVRNKVKTDDLSGCVVSHAPGTGKTRLAITFVQSYLELFPRCSPVIIAPSAMLATWEHEFRKWNVKVPFHILNSPDVNRDGDKTIERMEANDENFAQKLSIENYRRLLKLQSWVEGNSIIGLSYKMFTILAKEEGEDEDNEDEEGKEEYSKIRQLFLQRPDLLILDEGHIPRNRNSKIWKALAKVRTEKRIILSGTPFQNNFEELHNILFLLRDQVTSAVDQPSLERLQLKPYEGVKARFVYEIVRRCHSKERVLVFSQYHEPLDLIREQLSTKFHWTKDKEILQMSGKVCLKTRQSLMMAFNDMNSDAKVMLATTKACGEGIQLIGASRVVLLDVVWNPSVGRQAIGRAYRIGQEKIVYTYNLIAEGTQEKSKYDRQAQKEHMSKKLFSNETRLAEPDLISSDKILEEMAEDENLKEIVGEPPCYFSF